MRILVDYDNDPGTNNSVQFTDSANSDGRWEIQVPNGNALTEGQTIRVELVSGFFSGATVYDSSTITLDSIAPNAPLAAINAALNSTTPTITGTAEALSRVTLTLDPDNDSSTSNSAWLTTTADSNGDWSIGIPARWRIAERRHGERLDHGH